MITEQDLKEAIAECQGQRNPNSSTCIKLAAFLTIQRELYGKKKEVAETPAEMSSYSFEAAVSQKITDYQGGLGKFVNGKDVFTVLDVFEELLGALHVTNPELYGFAIRKLKQI